MTVEREPHRAARRPRELGREERLDSRSLLAAEAPSDVLGEHAHLLRVEAEAARQLAARVEDPLRRDPGGELVAVPARDGGVRLERCLDVCRRLARELHPDLGGREGAVRIAADRLGRVLREALLVESARGVERREHLVVGSQRGDACRGGLGRVGRDGRDGLPGPRRLGREHACAGHRERAFWAEHRSDTGRRARSVEVEARHPRAGRRRPKHAGMEHARQRDVDRVACRAARAERAVLARRGLADDRQLCVLGPGDEVVLLVDERPDVLEAPFHLALGLDEPLGHPTACPEAPRIARSILGYVPHRQRFPLIAVWISSRVGLPFASSSAVAETI